MGLADLDPALRLEFSAEYATVTEGQTVKIIGKVTNGNEYPIASGTVSLNTYGRTIAAATGTSLAGLAPGAS